MLAAKESELPPILVHWPSLRVIDGMHRTRAAILQGRTHIRARLFEGGAEEAFVLAVKANVKDGLPLTLAERTAAATRILISHPQWSDRSIASITGLAGKTVGELRRRTSEGVPQPERRIGRDGRARPLDTAQGRRTAGELFTENPEASLREVARKAGISPGTARDVRDRLRRGEDVVPPRRLSPARKEQEADGCRRPAMRLPEQDLTAIFKDLCRDPSLRHTDTGRLLLRMLEMHLAGNHWDRITSTVPAHHASRVAAAAKECAQVWEAFAVSLEKRGRA
ncbi:streptomycin biosynthesis regulator [Streptomyces sp. AJS327]|uniref:ParB/RepB/Spo0J family partition protein n=1 Tax=Streptomyces sp. AJS327 TaxID=2545265 RepID=UPI002155A909|nr:streptomycin biosynthesis regulator [Streptomyces sp. AJS327]